MIKKIMKVLEQKFNIHANMLNSKGILSKTLLNNSITNILSLKMQKKKKKKKIQIQTI